MKPFKFLARTAPILFGNLSFIDNQQVMFAKQIHPVRLCWILQRKPCQTTSTRRAYQFFW
jgi:hypothetical protein